MKSLHAMMLMLVVMALSACAQPTPYQPDDGGYGFVEEAIGEDQYRITFVANALTTRARLDQFLLYRAAELAKADGYDYFIVGSREEFFDPLGLGGPVQHASFARKNELHLGSGIRAGFGEEMVERYGASLDVLLQNGEPLTGADHIFTADEVIERLSPIVLGASSP